MTRLLLVHQSYSRRLPSGENVAVSREIRGLRDAGAEVTVLDVPSPKDRPESMRPRLGDVAGFEHRATYRELLANRPDVVLVHNLLPGLGAWVVADAVAASVPVAMRVDNYRLGCLAGTAVLDGTACRRCEQTAIALPGIRHACYGGGRAPSAVAAVKVARLRRRIPEIEAFLACGSHVAGWLRRVGVAEEAIRVVPNGVEETGPVHPPGDGLLFVGRAAPEKGLGLLVDAWELAGRPVTLRIAGPDPDDPALSRARRLGAEPLGHLDRRALTAALDAAAVVAVPSTWDEPFGLAAVEAMARARPVLATDRGELRHLVDHEVGWSTQPNVDDMSRAIVEFAATPRDELERRGRAGHQAFLDRYELGRVSVRLLDELARIGHVPPAARPRSGR